MKKKNEKYNYLLSESLKLFARYGYKKTTIEDVASKLSMTKGNIYFYVKNKKELYEETIKHSLIEWQNYVTGNMEKEINTIKKFKVMAKSAMDYIEVNGNLRKVLQNDPEIFSISENYGRFKKVNDKSTAIIEELLKEGTQNGSFIKLNERDTSLYLFSVYMMFLIKTYVFVDKESYKNLFETALEINLNGILNK